MTLEPERVADEIEAELRAVGTPERAEGEKRYLKSDLEHFGATLAEIRRAAKARANTNPDHDLLLGIVTALWSRSAFELRMAAVLLLEGSAQQLGPADLPFLNSLIRDSHTWALVDVLAADVLGSLVIAHPNTVEALDAWATDPDFWVRRAALLAYLRPLKASQTAAFDRFGRYADAMLDEHEFFIRKAIGWVLREQGKRDPDQVYGWLAPRVARASGVTVREALKYLKPAQRDELLAAYRTRRARTH
jgi:3-methyladenine DNA glycosylase AlkD